MNKTLTRYFLLWILFFSVFALTLCALRISVVPADTVFYSTGIRPNADTVEELKALAGEIPVKVIGDANKSGKMGDAVRGGYMAVMEIV